GLGSQASIAGKTDGAEARRIDYATDAGARASLEHGAGAVHVVAVDLASILRPQPIVRRDVEDEAAAGEGGVEGLRVEDVAAEDLDAAAGERLEAARRPREDPHAVAVGDEQPRHVGSHEAGGPGDQHVHGATSSASLLLFSRGSSDALVGGGCYDEG